MQKRKFQNIVDTADVIRDFLPICAGAKKGLYDKCKDCFGYSLFFLRLKYKDLTGYNKKVHRIKNTNSSHTR